MPGDNPNWKPFLDKIPESLHPIVKPVLAEWDQGVQQALEEKTQELKKYEPYKQFLDANIDPAWLVEAADLAYNFEKDPKLVIKNANEAWNLGFNLDGTPQGGQGNDSGAPDDLFDGDDDMPQDITKHPQFAELMQVVNGLKENVDSFTSQQDQERQAREFEQFIKGQHEQHGAFDENYVTALMANGQSFPQALDAYHTFVASLVDNGEQGGDENNNQNDQAGSDGAPVVMGGAGNAGSGLDQQQVSFGDMKSSDLEDVVEQMLANASQADANNS